MMTMKDYLDEYTLSHKNKVNKLIHKICVPSIMLSIFMILDSIPGPVSFCFMLVSFSMVFYLATKTPMKFVLIILIQSALFLLITFALKMPLKLYLGIGIFVIAWIGQFYGHHVEGKKPSFLKDLLFLLIGPIWVWYDLLKK